MISVRGSLGPVADLEPLPDTVVLRYPHAEDDGIESFERPARFIGDHLAVVQHSKLDYQNRPMTCPGWRIIVRGIGAALLGMFGTEGEAIAAAREGDDLTDWSDYFQNQLQGIRPEDGRFNNVRAAWLDIAERRGTRVHSSIVVSNKKSLESVSHEL